MRSTYLKNIIEEEMKEFESKFAPARSGYTNDGKDFIEAFAHRLLQEAFREMKIKNWKSSECRKMCEVCVYEKRGYNAALAEVRRKQQDLLDTLSD